jgi:type IV secretory pathway TraG/TraD family ATPase VirD4
VFFLDEFSSLGEMRSIKELLVRARSKGAICIWVCRNVSRLSGEGA